MISATLESIDAMLKEENDDDAELLTTAGESERNCARAGKAARENMQAIIDRVEARMQERRERRERGLLRRIFSR